jgi:hypothetical protein
MTPINIQQESTTTEILRMRGPSMNEDDSRDCNGLWAC